MPNFNDLTVDLDDGEAFPSLVYERTKENPNEDLSTTCPVCTESLDGYAKRFLGNLVPKLGK